MTPAPKDTGLRQILTWTLIAFIVALLLTAAGVTLVVQLFDRP